MLTKKQKIGVVLIAVGIPGLFLPIIPGIPFILCGILLVINHKLGTEMYLKIKEWREKRATIKKEQRGKI